MLPKQFPSWRLLILFLPLLAVWLGSAPSSLAASNAALRRYPYLTDVVGSYATINWSTDRSQTSGAVRYGKVGSESCTAHYVPATKTAISVNGVLQYQWKAELELLPGTQYCYRVYLGSGPSTETDLLGSDSAPSFWTQMPMGATQSFSFAVFGDWGYVGSSGTNSYQANVMSRIAASGARFAVTTGDNGYPSGSQKNFGDLVQTGADTSAIFGPSFWKVPGSSMPIFLSMGNHGLTSSDSSHPFLVTWPQDRAVSTSGGRYARDTYCCLNGTSSASYPSAWYAFDAGPARFYILDTAWSDSNVGTADPYKNDYDYHWAPGTAQLEWLKRDLAAHPSILKFAIFHYPLYSDNPNEAASPYLLGSSGLEGLLKQNGVDIAFTGHAHIYERNLPSASGIYNYITGGGGATPGTLGTCTALDAYAIKFTTTGKACGSAPVPTSADQVYHFLKVTVNGTNVTVTPINSLGQTFDVRSYSFSSDSETTAPSVPGSVDATAVSGTQVNVTWSASSDNTGVRGYGIYRNGTLIATVDKNARSYSDTNLTPSTNYSYRVDAFDGSANHSAQSAAQSVTTQGTATYVFPAIADSYVAADFSTTNYGLSGTLKADGSPEYRSYLRFNVDDIVGTVTNATLRLYTTSSSSAGYQVNSVTSQNWEENTITYANAPAVGPAIGSSGNFASGNWISVDVTSLVNSNGIYDLAVTTTNSNVINFNSRDASAGNGPQLVIQTTTGTVSTPTATRTPTATAATTTATPSQTATGTVSTPGSGTTLTFTTVADARVSEASPTTNYGTATTLQADAGTGATQTSYIRFTTTGINGPVQSAKLRVFASTNGTANGPAAQLADSNWTESGTGGINWNNRPALLSGAFDNKGAIGTNTWVEYDVTGLVSGNGTYTFALVADGSDGITFSSREGTAAPQLVVQTQGGATATSTSTPTRTSTLTTTATATPSATATMSPTPTIAATGTSTSTATKTPTGTSTSTATVTPLVTASPTSTSTSTPTSTQTLGATATSTATSTVGAGTTLTFTTVADARVAEGSPTTNYGTANNLQADGDTVQMSYIRFNVSGVTGPIQNVKLRVFCTTNGTNNGPAAYLADSNWIESGTGGITWNTRPALLSGAFDNKGAIPTNTWVEYNVTGLVSGNGTYTFALVADGSDGIVFSSREGTAAPQLVIETQGGPSATSTSTATSTVTSVSTSTATSTATVSATATMSPTATATVTQTATGLATASPTATSTPTSSATTTATALSTSTATLTPTATPTTAAVTDTPAFTSTAAPGATLTFTTVADARVVQASPTTNYGTSTTLQADGDTVQTSFIRFNTSGISGQIQSATLRVFATTNGTVNGPAVHLANSNWIESGTGGVTWNTQPALLTGAVDNAGAFGTNTWVEYDVTSVVTGNGTYTFALVADSTDGVTFSSREGTAAPQLVVQTGSGPVITSTATTTSTSTLAPTHTSTATATSTLSPTPTNTSTVNPTATSTSTATVTPSQTLTATPTRTLASTATHTPTATSTATAMPSHTDVPTLTSTAAPTATDTPTRTASPTFTNPPPATHTPTQTETMLPTATDTGTNTPVPTSTRVNTETPTLTATSTHTFTPQPTDVPSMTPTDTPTRTPTATRTLSVTPSATETPADTDTPTATPSRTPTATDLPTSTRTPSETPEPTETDTPRPTRTPTPKETDTPVATETPTEEPTPTLTFTPSPTATERPSRTPTATDVPTDTPTSTYTLEPTETHTPTRTPTEMDTQTPTATETPTPLPDDIFADGFESGDLSAWSSNESDPGDLTVTAAAALDGDNGLQVELNDNNPAYVVDDTPNAETRYRARFYFDPNSIQMADGESFYLFAGYSDSTTDVLRVELRFFNGIYQLRSSLRNNGSTWTDTNWIDLDDVPHLIELNWSAASAGQENGSLMLWVDDLQVANLTQIDNGTRRINEVRLGAVDEIDTGTRGILYLDAFESRRQTYIGPVEPAASAPK